MISDSNELTTRFWNILKMFATEQEAYAEVAALTETALNIGFTVLEVTECYEEALRG